MHAFPLLALLATATAAVVVPSDPSGVYAVLDRVVLQPNAEAPTSVELHGAFALAEGGRGQYYRAPRIGVLRFQLGKDREASIAQWRELLPLAGTGKIVSFGSRYEQHADGKATVRVETPDLPPAPLVPFATGWGVRPLENVNYGPARELGLLPRCAGADVGTDRTHRDWPEREVVFTATNCKAPDDELRYVFRVETSDGECVASGLVVPGKGLTTWTTALALQAGETVNWSVQVVGRNVERAPVAQASFVVPAAAVEREK